MVPSFGNYLSYPDQGLFDVLGFFSLLRYYGEEKGDSVTLRLQDLQALRHSNLLVKADAALSQIV